jgi:hypothetical protein
MKRRELLRGAAGLAAASVAADFESTSLAADANNRITVGVMTGQRPETVADYRRVLDDARVAALVIGTPDHWHALPKIEEL